MTSGGVGKRGEAYRGVANKALVNFLRNDKWGVGKWDVANRDVQIKR